MSFIDSTDLMQFTAMVTEAADSEVQWYTIAGAPDRYGKESYQRVQTLNALVLEASMVIYDEQGYRTIPTRDYYFPGTPSIQPIDRVLLASETLEHSVPILHVELLPSAGAPVTTLVRTGMHRRLVLGQ